MSGEAEDDDADVMPWAVGPGTWVGPTSRGEDTSRHERRCADGVPTECKCCNGVEGSLQKVGLRVGNWAYILGLVVRGRQT